jgi:uncharacterized protein YqjF (DUF2071 family)
MRPVAKPQAAIPTGTTMSRRFLTAEWRYLLMLNYEIDPATLRPLLPKGTELDFWEGRAYVSMVGFRFLNTRVRGWTIPFHVNFEEINLRFYVRHRAEDGWRRGVVFVKEIVPRWAIAAVARWVYNENYVARPMRSQLRLPESTDDRGAVEYSWRGPTQWNRLAAEFGGTALLIKPGSEEEFITEHYWGYVPQRDGSTVEYRVAHPPWRVWAALGAEFTCAAAEFYGPQYAECLGGKPTSAFVAEGSAIEVYGGGRIT